LKSISPRKKIFKRFACDENAREIKVWIDNELIGMISSLCLFDPILPGSDYRGSIERYIKCPENYKDLFVGDRCLLTVKDGNRLVFRKTVEIKSEREYSADFSKEYIRRTHCFRFDGPAWTE
jgi:hypothetical protein